MSIKETKKKEIGFYINGEKSINEYIRKLKHFLKTYEKARTDYRNSRKYSFIWK